MILARIPAGNKMPVLTIEPAVKCVSGKRIRRYIQRHVRFQLVNQTIAVPVQGSGSAFILWRTGCWRDGLWQRSPGDEDSRKKQRPSIATRRLGRMEPPPWQTVYDGIGAVILSGLLTERLRRPEIRRNHPLPLVKRNKSWHTMRMANKNAPKREKKKPKKAKK